jgi:hypothetical protein
MPSFFSESETSERQRLRQQRIEREQWITDKQDALSYMYIYGKELDPSNPSNEKLKILKDYFSEHVPLEQQQKLKEGYDKLMNSQPGNWMVDGMRKALQNSEQNIEIGMDTRDKNNRIIAEEKRKAEEKKCNVGDYLNIFKPKKLGQCYNDNVIKPVTGFIAEGVGAVVSEIGDVLDEIPVVRDVLEGVSDAYEWSKDRLDDVGQAIKNSGDFGEALYEAGDWVHEQGLKHMADKINPIFGEQILETAMGTSIEDASLTDTAELIAGTVQPGVGLVLGAHEIIQATKDVEEEEEEVEVEEEVEEEDEDDEPVLQPVRQPVRQPVSQQPVRQSRQPATSGQSCRPRRKPISC